PAPADLLRFFAPWPTFTLYRPLTTFGAFWTARALLGLDPARWSVALLGVHIVNALLVYGIARRLLHSRPAGLATALVCLRAGARARGALVLVLHHHGNRAGLLRRPLDLAVRSTTRAHASDARGVRRPLAVQRARGELPRRRDRRGGARARSARLAVPGSRDRSPLGGRDDVRGGEAALPAGARAALGCGASLVQPGGG